MLRSLFLPWEWLPQERSELRGRFSKADYRRGGIGFSVWSVQLLLSLLPPTGMGS